VNRYNDFMFSPRTLRALGESVFWNSKAMAKEVGIHPQKKKKGLLSPAEDAEKG